MPRRTRMQQGIQSIEVGGKLLKALAAAREPMMLRDLAALAHLPAAQAHRYLVSFIRMGLIEQDVATARYDLGAFTLEMGVSALSRLEPVTMAIATLPALARDTGQSVAIAIWGNLGPTVVRWYGSDAPASASLKPGLVIPLTISASGRVFLAFLPRETTRSQLRRELTANARRGVTPMSMDEVERTIADTRRRGYVTLNTMISGLSTLAVPVCGADGNATLCLIAVGYSKPFDVARLKIAATLLAAAKSLSKQLARRT